MKKIIIVMFLLLMSGISVQAKKAQSEAIITPMTQLEKRQFQTRSYNAADRNIVMKAILNVLQDEGFVVYNVNSLLGFIYGVKDFDTSDPNVDITKEFNLSKSRLNLNGIKVATLDVNANVVEFEKVLRVRINFKRKLLNIYGNAQFIEDVEDEEFYKDFYNKLDKVIYLLKQGL